MWLEKKYMSVKSVHLHLSQSKILIEFCSSKRTKQRKTTLSLWTYFDIKMWVYIALYKKILAEVK